MTSPSTRSLCTECGLCCNGVLFADVELENTKEATTMETLGLEVEEEEGQCLLIQPCRALDGSICSIYEHRPDCCRRFECKLLLDVKNEEISLTGALRVIRRLRRFLADEDRESARKILNQRFLNRSDPTSS